MDDVRKCIMLNDLQTLVKSPREPSQAPVAILRRAVVRSAREELREPVVLFLSDVQVQRAPASYLFDHGL